MTIIKYALIALFLIFLAGVPAHASGDPVADTRKILAGTVTTTSSKNAYLTGARDSWTSFKGALGAYKAVRAAELPPVVVPLPLTEFELPAGVALRAIASEFDATAALVPSWGNGAIPASAAPDVVGAFRFICQAGQLLRDDPIVFPGQPGASHLHQFFGALDANANSTYATLRGQGGSTCGDVVIDGVRKATNRSAYWMPAMLDGKGSVVRPDQIAVYYKRRPISDPKCSLTSGDPQATGNCLPLPNGLRFIAGFDMVTNTPKTGSAYFNCDGPTGVQGHYATIGEAAANCPTAPTLVKQWDGSMLPTYNRLGAIINMPDCWDGKNLDSLNHRSHVSYGGYGDWGFYKCPPTHPFVIPTFTMGVWFTVDANLGTWSLSSDAMHPEQPAGSTFHADWFGAWDNGVEAMWMDNCINKLLNCSGGDLGNGKQIKDGWARGPLLPRLVPVPN